MTEKHKNDRSHKQAFKRKTSYSTIIMLLIAIIGLGSYLAIDSNTQWVKDFFADNSKTPEPINIDSPVELEEDILKFAPDEPIDGCLTNEDLDPYNQTEESNAETFVMPEETMVNNLNDYRIYLANVNELIMKFLQTQNYADNLAIIKQFQLPKEIEEIVIMLESYNTMILDAGTKEEKILLFNTDIFEKFLKITKDKSSAKDMLNLRTLIESKLGTLTNFIFSEELQGAFLK